MKDKSQLYYFIFTCLYALIAATGNEKIFMQVFPNLSYEFIIHLRVAVIYISIVFMTLFIREIDEKLIPKTPMKVWMGLFIAFSISSVILKVTIYGKFENIYLLMIIIYYIYLIFCMIRALLKRKSMSINGTDLVMLLIIIVTITAVMDKIAMMLGIMAMEEDSVIDFDDDNDDDSIVFLTDDYQTI